MGIAIYVICWWMVLFAVLPFRIGAGTAGEDDAIAKSSGAPPVSNLLLKFILTTVIAAIVFALVYAVIVYKIIDLDSFPFLNG
jgi:predicted secreted protein